MSLPGREPQLLRRGYWRHPEAERGVHDRIRIPTPARNEPSCVLVKIIPAGLFRFALRVDARRNRHRFAAWRSNALTAPGE